MNLLINFQTFCALLYRDLKILKLEFATLFLNGIITVILDVLIFGYLLPLMGMNQQLISPMYIGSIVLTLLLFGFTFGLNHATDLSNNRYIEYQLILPLPKHWLFAEYVIYFIIQGIILSLPLVTIGIWLLGSRFVIYQISWISFVLLYTLTLFFYALLFLAIVFSSSFEWFCDNIWIRIITPMITFGTVFYIWQFVYLMAPALAILMLLNPFTYISEGLRSTLIGSNQFLPASLCLCMMLLSILFVSYIFKKGMYKRLDPV